jgi:dCMP deaminase
MEDKAWLDTLQQVVLKHPGRPSWNTYFMSIALLLSARSSCERLHVGCVLVSGVGNKNRIIAAGYNGFLPGLPHRSIVKDGHEQATVHAEQNALADAARRGVTIQNAIAYVTHFPCINCAKMLLAAGINHCYYHEDYRNDNLVFELFKEAGIGLEKY